MKLTDVEYYRYLKPEPKHAGFSDIRMWPGYIVFSVSTLFFARWLGYFLAIVLVGAPSMYLMLRVSGLVKSKERPKKSKTYVRNTAVKSQAKIV